MPAADHSSIFASWLWRSRTLLWGDPEHDLSVSNESRVMHFTTRVVRHLAGIGVVCAIATFYRHVDFDNVTTVGFTFLLAILCSSSLWGLSVAMVMSVVAALTYDYYFLPPIGVFNISDARDWIALGAFVVTVGIGAYLSAWARREARTANQRRRETEQLYSFSQLLLAAGDPKQLLEAIPRYVVESFGTGPVVLSLADRHQVYSYGRDGSQVDREALALPGQGVLPVDVNNDLHVVPLRAGGRVLGNLRISSSAASTGAIEALAALTVVAVERAQ